MGVLFIEKTISLFDHKCKNCNTVVMKDDDVMVTTVETIYGNCVGSTHCSNTHAVKTVRFGIYTAYSTVNMYDEDSNEDLHNSIPVIDIHCKQCMFFLGWKHDKIYIFLKKNLTTGVESVSLR